MLVPGVYRHLRGSEMHVLLPGAKRLVVLLFVFVYFLTFVNLSLAQAPIVVILEEPTLSPPYTTTCKPDDSFWYPVDSGRGHKAFLTLNVATQASSTNSAIWRPTLPESGLYKVEAYIPAHAAIHWECPSKDILGDTRDARYTIRHAQGETKISRDQAAASGAWLNLGEYLFKEGEEGFVHLTDLNTETSLETTVSFSAMRFTRQSAYPDYQVFLPYTGREMGARLILNRTYTADPSGITKSAFIPRETVYLAASGINEFGMDITAAFEFQLSGPCGFNQVYSEMLSLPSGGWIAVKEVLLPECQGTYTYELRLNHHSLSSTTQHIFVVNLPSQVVVTTLPAFDKCNIPTLSQLSTWFNYSPYKVVNLYIGGISRSCANTALTPTFISNAAQQGWSFIPTWVGPQSPCSQYKNKISSDISQAYWQGRYEADAAHLAAERLGLGNDTVIYYNMERFPNTDVGCREATRSFLNGWTLRLHELGARSGVYGVPSNMSYWYSIANAPDDVWIASWYASAFDPYASVWTVPNFSASLWPNNQRLRQYAGEIIETYGGLRMTIDANATQGRVARIPQASSLLGNYYGPLRPSAWAAAADLDHLMTAADQALQSDVDSFPGSAPTRPAHLLEMKLLSSGHGWVLYNDRLLWSRDGGLSWLDRTPPDSDLSIFLAAHFSDESQGWLAAASAENDVLRLLHWNGLAWEESRFSLPPDLKESVFSSAQFEFLDESTGWLAVKLQTGSNFSLGELFGTHDGGQSWERLSMPTGGTVRFVSAERGWAAGGPGGDELFTTADGGATWQPVLLPDFAPRSEWVGETYFGLPYFQDRRNGLLPVTTANEQVSRLYLYASSDGGTNWKLAGSMAVESEVSPAMAYQIGGSGTKLWLISPLDTSISTVMLHHALPSILAQNFTNPLVEGMVRPALPVGALEVEFNSDGLGWALINFGLCQEGRCESSSSLWLSQDGGQNWSEITP
jgi:photosystem II stability/assembly factor-like uncharacterized protein